MYDDTLTIYPKQIAFPPVRNQHELLMVTLFMQMNCSCARVSRMFDMRRDELGVYRFVSRNDDEHHLFHQDDFDMEEDHYHAQFSRTIDDVKLGQILSILERYNLITSEEHERFISAYRVANTIPAAEQLVQSTTVANEKAEPALAAIIPKQSETVLGGESVRGYSGLFFAPTASQPDDEPKEYLSLCPGKS